MESHRWQEKVKQVPVTRQHDVPSLNLTAISRAPKRKSFPNHHFSGALLVFGGVVVLFFPRVMDVEMTIFGDLSYFLGPHFLR